MFTLEDQAPPFDPLAPSAAEETPAPRPIDQLQLGGRGIPLMRKFAGSLAYQRLPGGNRLTIGFDPSRARFPDANLRYHCVYKV